MAISKRCDIPAGPAVYRPVDGFGNQSYYQNSREQVWPIRWAIWFWIGLSAVGWTSFAALVS